jgi:PPOX class probable F420-dependent enzyme
MDESTMRALAGNARVARLGTVNAAGAVDLVPVTFALATAEDGGDVLVTAVDHKPKRSTRLARLQNVRRDPRVTVLVDHYDDEWSTLWWVRMRGQGVVIEPDDPGHAGTVAPLAAKYAQYRDHPPAGAAIVVSVEEWRGWSALE